MTTGLSIEADEQGHQRRRAGRTVFDEAARHRLDSGREGRIRRQPGKRRRSISREPVEAEEHATRQMRGDRSGESRLAAAERAGDVGEAPKVAQVERLAAPWPGQIEGNGERWRLEHAKQFAGCGHRAVRQLRPEHAELFRDPGEIADLALDDRLVPRQRRLEIARIALEHPRHLPESEAELPQGDDFGRSRQMLWAILPPACGVSVGNQEATLLIEPQGLGRDAEPARGLSGIDELAWSHDSPRKLEPASLSGRPQGPGQWAGDVF